MISGCNAAGQNLYTETGGNTQENGFQAMVFGCIEYYSTQCVYDISNMAGSGAQGAAFSRAMREFATCADRSPQPEGYCHGALKSAAQLSNQAVCENGAQVNLGFHVRIPFRVLQQGTFTFRIHADYGLGSFIGVDGAEHTPGNSWGHLQLAPSTLTAGDHEFESLGFEDCCDGHQELEVHLNCDTASAPWRIVVAGTTDCMTCTHTSILASCSAEYGSSATYNAGEAAHCGGSGGSVSCQASAGGCGEGNSFFDGEEFFTDGVGINPQEHQFSLDFRFRTATSRGVQLHSGTAQSSTNEDHVTFELMGGQENFDFSTGTGDGVVRATGGDDLADNVWHTVTGVREMTAGDARQTTGFLQVDAQTFPGPIISGSGYQIGADQPLYIGGQPNLLSTQNAGMGMQSMQNFVGCMGGVHYEQIYEMSNANAGLRSGEGAVTAGTCGEAPGMFIAGDGDQYTDCASCCGDDSGCRHCVCNFANGDSAHAAQGQNSGQFDGGQMLTFGSAINPVTHNFVITFSMKTSADDAIILAASSDLECAGLSGCSDGTGSTGCCEGVRDDHLVVQIVKGRLQFNFGLGSDCNVAGSVNTGGGCDNTVTVGSAALVNDGEWHVVRVARPALQTATITVDGVTVEATAHGPNNAIDISGSMHIGGHPNPSSFQLGLEATTNFVGCLSDIYYEMDYVS